MTEHHNSCNISGANEKRALTGEKRHDAACRDIMVITDEGIS